MALIGIFFGLLIRRSLVRVQVGEPKIPSEIREPHSDVGLFVLLRNIGNTTQKIDPFLTIKIEY